jgi:hypothetical protein
MTLFGLDISGDHARVILAAIGTLFAGAGFIAGRWSHHRNWARFRAEDLVTTSVVIELYGIKTGSDGRDTLHIISQGSSAVLDAFFRNPVLIGEVQRAAARHPGLLRLANPVAHRMMMEEGKDTITGLDPKANMDFLHGRPTRDDATLFAFAAYKESDRGDSPLHDQVSRLILMVASPETIAKVSDPRYVETLAVAHPGYQPRCGRLHDFAQEWQRLSALPASARAPAIDTVWQITVRTSLH